MSISSRILIVDDLHAALKEQLEQQGHHVSDMPTIKSGQIVDAIKDYEGLVVRSKIKVTQSFLDQAPNLRFIARAGAGLDNLDMAAIEARGIQVVNAPEGNRDSLGEHMLGMLLTLLHKTHLGNQQVRNKQWLREDNRGVELKGKTVGIIGFGHMGSAFAEKLLGFGCRIVAYDKYKEDLGMNFIEPVSFAKLKAESDIVSLHVPLTEETHHMVNEGFFKNIEKSIYFLNAARGKVVDTTALIEALRSGVVLGAALDVLENEKFSTFTSNEEAEFDLLVSFPQVLFSPHVGGWSVESYERISLVLAEKIRALLG